MVSGSHSLSKSMRALIDQNAQHGLGVSAISCWEVAKLVEKGRLQLNQPTGN
jgi:PIN domain nuclease of toxin-antitoxin system